MAINLIYPTKTHTHICIPWIHYLTIILEVGHYSKQVTDLSQFHANTMTPKWWWYSSWWPVSQSVDKINQFITSITNEWWNVELVTTVEWMVQFMYTCWYEKTKIHFCINLTRNYWHLLQSVSDVRIKWLSSESKRQAEVGGKFCRE